MSKHGESETIRVGGQVPSPPPLVSSLFSLSRLVSPYFPFILLLAPRFPLHYSLFSFPFICLFSMLVFVIFSSSPLFSPFLSSLFITLYLLSFLPSPSLFSLFYMSSPSLSSLHHLSSLFTSPVFFSPFLPPQLLFSTLIFSSPLLWSRFISPFSSLYHLSSLRFSLYIYPSLLHSSPLFTTPFLLFSLHFSSPLLSLHLLVISSPLLSLPPSSHLSSFTLIFSASSFSSHLFSSPPSRTHLFSLHHFYLDFHLSWRTRNISLMSSRQSSHWFVCFCCSFSCWLLIKGGC